MYNGYNASNQIKNTKTKKELRNQSLTEGLESIKVLTEDFHTIARKHIFNSFNNTSKSTNQLGELSKEEQRIYDNNYEIMKKYFDFATEEYRLTRNTPQFYGIEQIYGLSLHNFLDF